MSGSTRPRPDWYDNAVVYAIDVKAFQDTDGDGVGDFEGLIERLDYLNRLGVSVLWLLPFYPTPNRDNGYDVMDYYGVDDRLGSLGDFVAFVHEADDRGIQVIIDLVVNHTSDQHPWFRAARADRDSPYRDYYVWADEPPEPDDGRTSVFPGEVEDDRVWTYDAEADAYYYHRFYPFQPDLNLQNPDVREEIRRIMAFWLELGVSGFRIDAATLMIQGKDPSVPAPDDPHELLRELKRTATRERGDAVLLAEADDDPEALASYFGDDEMDLLLNFVMNAHVIHALAVEAAAPIEAGLDRVPNPPPHGRWVNFLRNYDELNLGRLAPGARREVFQRFAPDRTMRIYGRGIRRRLAGILDGDRERIELAFSLLFALPGVPLLMAGDEIGMGDDLSLPGRAAVRTPMQWSAERNGGFSTAPESSLVRPVIDEGPFSFERVNVADQRAEPGTLLNWTERLIATRKECSEINSQDYAVVDTADESVFALEYPTADGALLTLHNLAGEPRTAEIEPSARYGGSVSRLLGDELGGLTDGSDVSLDRYGYGWYRFAGAS